MSFPMIDKSPNAKLPTAPSPMAAQNQPLNGGSTSSLPPSNAPGGLPQGLPSVGGQYYPTIDAQHPAPPGYDQPFTGSPIYDPFGVKRPHEKYEGKVDIWGGGQDLEKSVATRSLGIEMMQQEMNAPAMPAGLEGAMKSYGANNPYLASMVQNTIPGLKGQAFAQNQAYQNQLTDLLSKTYVLGGALYGQQLRAWTQAKAAKKATDLAKTQKLQAIIGGIGTGLTGGGGGGGGMGGGGGGGGGNDYGSVDTTVGLIGVLEL